MPELPFEAYLDQVCAGVLAARSRSRVRKELLDHLNCKYETLTEEEGLPEAEAAAQALESFGEAAQVRAQITRAHLGDNLMTVGKGLGQFLLSLLVTAGMLLVQAIVLLVSSELDIYIFHFSLLFFCLLAASFYAAHGRRILLPLFLIPLALAQCFLLADGMVTALNALPELVIGNLPGFLRDLSAYENVALPASIAVNIAFVLLYIVLNLVISIASFRVQSKRSTAGGVRAAMCGLAVLAAVLLGASVLCCCSLPIPPHAEPMDYIKEYHLIPAADEAETQRILDFYEKNPVDKVYPSSTEACVVWYHHDLDSGAIAATVYLNGRETEDRSVIVDESNHYVSSRNAFHEAFGSKVIFAPKQTHGFLVAVPVVDGIADFAADPDRATILQLPLQEDTSIFGNMNANIYEIVVQQGG